MKKTNPFLLFFLFLFVATLVTVLIHDIFFVDMDDLMKERKKMLEAYVVGEWWADFGRDSSIQIIFYPDLTFLLINNSSIPFFVKKGDYNGNYYLQVDTKFNDIYIDFFAQGWSMNQYFKWIAYEKQNSFWNIEGTWCIHFGYMGVGNLCFRKVCDSVMRTK